MRHSQRDGGAARVRQATLGRWPATSFHADTILQARYLPIIAIICVALLTRLPSIGDPTIHMDEQFYLLMGDRMLHGALPYVDIWDRKPVGLFLIFAALRPLSSDGIVAYQLGALVCTIATAELLRRIATMFTDRWGAITAAIAYILFPPFMSGAGGQSPIFYNMLMALAAYYVLRAGTEAAEPRYRHYALRCMALCGLALQIKYSVLTEGVFFGAWLVLGYLRRSAQIHPMHVAVPRAAILALAMIFTALAPTLLVAGYYAAIGQFQPFFYANFESIFRVAPAPASLTHRFLLNGIILLGPLLALALAAAGQRVIWAANDRKPLTSNDIFLALWTVAAVAGALMLKNNYPHYALPVLLPLSVLAGTLLQKRSALLGIAIFATWYLMFFATLPFEAKAQDRVRIAALRAALQPYADRGCIYINDGPTILYLLTNACLPTPYIFPEHLNNAGENASVGAVAAMNRLIAKRPAAIMIADHILDHPRNRRTAALLDRAVARDYRPVARLPDIFNGRNQIIYARKDLL